MTIQPLTNNSNNVASPSKSVAKEKTESTNAQTPKQVKDSIDMSAFAKEISKHLESSTIDKVRVKAVRDALDYGTYSINAEEIAKKMIQMEQEQHHDSRQHYDK